MATIGRVMMFVWLLLTTSVVVAEDCVGAKARSEGTGTLKVDSTASRKPTSLPMRRSKEVEECLRWLPEDAETLLVSSGRIRSLLPWNPPEHGDGNEPWTFADTIALGLLGPSVGVGSPVPNERQQEIVRSFLQDHLRLVVGVCRTVNYDRTPKCDRCSLIYVDNAAGPRILAALGKHCTSRHMIRNREVLEFRLAEFCSSRYEFVVSPRDDLLVGASTLDTLNILLLTLA